MVKRVILLAVLSVVLVSNLFASRFAIGVSTWSASPGVSDATGLHAQLGLSYAIAPRLELEAFTVIQLASEPISNVKAAVSVSLPLANPLFMHDQIAPLYYNAFVSVGYIQTVHGTPSHALFVRITPLSLGGPYYGARERSLAVALVYDFTDRSFGVFWNLFMFDRYM